MVALTSDIFNQAVTHHRSGNHEHAESLYLQILDSEPENLDVLCNLAYLYHRMGRAERAIEILDKARSINAEHAGSYNVLGVIHLHKQEFTNAVNNFEKAISYGLRSKDIYLNLATAAVRLGDYSLVVRSLRSHMDLTPFNGKVLALLMHNMRSMLDWDGLQDIETRLKIFVDSKEGEIPMYTLPYSQLDELHLKDAAKSHSHVLRQRHGLFSPPVKGPHRSGDKIKIGYFCSNVRAHPVGLMSLNLYRNHDRSQFEVYGYGVGVIDDSPVSRSIRGGADVFRNLSAMADKEAAAVIRADDLDILVDLSGYSQDHRQGILLRRPCGVIVNYLGFCGTMESDYHNYIITDRVLLPESRRMNYSETPLYVSCAYGHSRVDFGEHSAGTRSDYNLPEDKVIVGCFHEPEKISPGVFNAWMVVLEHCSDAHLWLLRHNGLVEDNFRQLASRHSVSADRITFSDIAPIQHQRGRYAHVDIIADTFPYGGDMNSMDGLYEGVPMVSYMGETMSSRIGASFLYHVGMRDFIAATTQDYIHRLCSLIDSPDKLRNLRDTIRSQVRSSAIFDGVRLVRELEEYYRRIVAQRQ